jgi:hypothetical protein
VPELSSLKSYFRDMFHQLQPQVGLLKATSYSQDTVAFEENDICPLQCRAYRLAQQRVPWAVVRHHGNLGAKTDHRLGHDRMWNRNTCNGKGTADWRVGMNDH